MNELPDPCFAACCRLWDGWNVVNERVRAGSMLHGDSGGPESHYPLSMPADHQQDREAEGSGVSAASLDLEAPSVPGSCSIWRPWLSRIHLPAI